MLFHVTWQFVDTSENGIRMPLAVYEKWQPPGAELQGSTALPRAIRSVWRLIEAEARNVGPDLSTLTPWLLCHGPTPIVPIMIHPAIRRRTSTSATRQLTIKRRVGEFALVKLVVTGASGKAGRAVVPDLVEHGP